MSRYARTIVAAAFVVAPLFAASAAETPKPNILVILTDDLGYGDIGVHGGRAVPTPNIDRLAASGVRCSNAYVTAPYCSPSRAGMLTGHCQTRFGHEFNPHDGDEATLGLPLDQTTLADRLGAEGYATALVGKWHLGFSPSHHPQQRGFDEFFGFLVGGHNYLLTKDGPAETGPIYGKNMLYRGMELLKLDGYATDLFTDEALDFISRQKEKPWFLYLAYNAVHTPLEMAPHLKDRLPKLKRRAYLSLLLGLDDNVGRVIDFLETSGEADNTLVFFVNDNGGAGVKLARNFAENDPLRGDKGQVLEGGIRVPFFVSWPGRLPAGKVYEKPVSALDVSPTSLAAAGADPDPETDGVDLLPYLMGENPNPPHKVLSWRFGPQKAIRKGTWKLVDWRSFDGDTQSGWQLYDLSKDIGESKDVAAAHPELVSELARDWEQWNTGNVPPLWPGSEFVDPGGLPEPKNLVEQNPRDHVHQEQTQKEQTQKEQTQKEQTQKEQTTSTLLPPEWNPKQAADRVLAGLINVSLPTVKGAHDSDFVVHQGKAYIVSMANDVRPGESAYWPFISSVFSVVDIAKGRVEKTVTFAASEMKFANETLPVGACFSPRIIQKDDRTLRCFFSSEDPKNRQSQTWYRDYCLARGVFDGGIHRVEIATSEGVFPMQPQYFLNQAIAEGFTRPASRYGLYPIDSFKQFDGRWHAVLNSYPDGLNAWAELNADMNRLTILGNFFEPTEAKLTESSVNRLPDGTWLAIARQENRDRNYMFTHSRDGRAWSPAEYRPLIPNGTSAKPTFDRFGDAYYLGWQEATTVNGVFRSVFNIEVSRDGKHWERKYRFATEKSFQYPVFRESDGVIYLTVTQGWRKERIMFGRLEALPQRRLNSQRGRILPP